MYTIKFRGKHQHKKPNVTNVIKDSCSNIESLTIDYDDLEYIRYCDFSDRTSPIVMLGGFLTGAQRLHKKSSSKVVTILNDSDLNEVYIYALLSCDWLLNSEDTNYDDLLGEALDELERLNKRLDDELDKVKRKKVENRIVLIEYRIRQLNKLRATKSNTYSETIHDNGRSIIFSSNPANRRAKQ